jgi:small-conductance mechanosensitive channel
LQPGALIAESLAWVEAHWLQIALATGAAVAIYLLLNLLRGWGLRLCRQGDGVVSWYAIAGRAVARTGQIFMILAATRLVVSYANAPPSVHATVVTLFTIAAVFQGAVWLRELVFGAIEHRTRGHGHEGEALVSALGIIRLLVTIALYAVASIVALSNLGVNVTGLVAGLGVGGIAIGLAAQGVFADLFAALAILFDRPFRIGDSISYDKGAGSGTVEEIGLKSTRIRGGGGEERIVANKKLLDFEILNTTRRLQPVQFRFLPRLRDASRGHRDRARPAQGCGRKRRLPAHPWGAQRFCRQRPELRCRVRIDRDRLSCRCARQRRGCDPCALSRTRHQLRLSDAGQPRRREDQAVAAGPACRRHGGPRRRRGRFGLTPRLFGRAHHLGAQRAAFAPEPAHRAEVHDRSGDVAKRGEEADDR